MTESNQQSDAVALDANSDWIAFTIAGHRFEVEVSETLDRLIDIDDTHALDRHRCRDCGFEFALTREDREKPESERGCAKCGSKSIRWCDDWAADVAKFLKSEHDVPRCSRGEAAKFYNHVLDVFEIAKKKRETPQESDTGSASTQAAGEV